MIFLEEDNKESTSNNIMPKVRTTDGHLMDWNRDAIIKQLLKETKLCEKFYGIPAIDRKTAETVAIEAENRIKKMDLKFLSGPLVREIVNVILLEIGKTEWRNLCTRVGTPVYDAYQIDIGNGYGAKDNANLQNNAESSHKHKADKISKEQYLLLLPPKLADAHLNGDIHIHDLEYFGTRPFCVDANTAIPVKINGRIDIITPSDFDLFFINNEYIHSDLYAFTPIGMQKIKKITRRVVAEDELLEIVTKTGKSIKVTKDHKIPVQLFNEIIDKKAKDIKIGDVLIGIRNKIKGDILTEIDLIKEIYFKVPTEIQKTVYVRDIKQIFKELKRRYKVSYTYIAKKIGMVHKCHYFKRGIMPLNIFIDLCNIFKIDYLKYDINVGVIGSRIVLPVRFRLTKQLMQILGLFVSEGNYNIEEKKNYNLVISGDHFINIVKDFAESINIRTEGKFKSKKFDQVYFGGKLLYLLFRYVFGIPEGSENKRLPNIIYNINDDLLSEFLSWLFIGDGSVYYRPDKSDCIISYTTSSEQLRQELSLLLNSLGIDVNLQSYYDVEYDSIKYRLQIYGYKNIQKISRYIKFDNKRQEYINRFLNEVNQIKTEEKIEFVTSITHATSSSKYVYDVFLEEGKQHRFFAGDGLLIHNCQSWDLRYFFYYGLMPDGSGTKASVAGPAKKPEVAILHAVKALGSAQTNFSGGQGFYNFLTFLAPYLEGLSYKEINQLMQMFAYELNSMLVARGGQSCCFSELIYVFDEHNNEMYVHKIGDFVDSAIEKYGSITLGDTETCIIPEGYYTFGMDTITGKIVRAPLYAVHRHKPHNAIVKLKTVFGSEVRITSDHSLFNLDENGNIIKISPTEQPKNILVARKIDIEPLFKFGDLIDISKRQRPKACAYNSENRTALALTKELIRFIGYYVSEGSLNDSNNICFTVAEKSLKSDMEYCIKKVFPNVTYRYEDGLIVFTSKPIATFLREVCGKGALNKKIPNFVLFGSEDIVKEFLSAYLSGDGSVKDGHILCYTESKSLYAELNFLFRRLDLLFSERIHGKKGGYILKEYQKYINELNKLKLLQNIIPAEVKGIKTIDYKGYVYDLSVKGTENFMLGNGIIAHNTVFSSVQLSPGVPKIWRDKPIVYQGKIWNGEQAPLRTYGEFEREVRLAFKALMEVMLQGDYWGKPFNFPKPEISIEPDFMIEDEEFNKNNPDLPTYEELYTLAFELSAKYGTPYFDNLLPEYRGAGKGISCYQCLSKEESIPIIKSDGEMAIKKLRDLFAYSAAKNGVSIDPYGVEFAPLKTVYTYVLNTEKLKTEIKSFKGVIRKHYKGKILRIITESGRQIKVTPDHKMLIVKNGTVVEQRAKEIKIGDYLPVMNHKTVSINLINGDLHILRVKKIQLEDYDDYVYSPLEVSQHHNFINLFGICTKNCCAYTFSSNKESDNEFEDKMYFRNGKHFSMGGWQVVSLNCPRAAYKAHGNDKKLFEELKRLMDIAVEVFKVKRQWMQEIIKSKRMPFIIMRPKDPITGVLSEIAVDLDGLVYTIGVVGINEMVQHHCGSQMHESKIAWKLAIRAMTEMELYAKELSNKHNMEIALARTPAESLPSDEFVWIKENNIIKRVQIGNIVDKYMELYSDNIEVIDNSMILDLSKLNIDLKTIAFNENYKMEEAKITKLIKHGPNEIYKIRTSHGVIRTTPCHSIFTVDDEGYPIPIRVSDLKIGDYIATPNSIDIPVDDDQIDLYENMKHLPNLQIISDRIMNDVSKWILSNRKTSVKDTKSLWLNDCNLEIPKENRDLYLKVAYSDSKASELPIYIEKHERLGTLLGYFISEGSVYITSGRRAIQISNNDINIINECKDIFQYYGIKVSVSRDKNGTYTLHASVSGHDFVCYGLQAIDNQGNKKIPNWLFNAPLDVVISFIKSYYKGDRFRNPQSAIRNPQSECRHDRTFKISTTNEDFANDISFLLRRIKVAPRITIRKIQLGANCSSGYEYTINVSGNDNLVRLKELGFDVTTGQKDTSDIRPKAKSLVYKLKNDLKLSKSQFTKLFECSDWMINAYYNKSELTRGELKHIVEVGIRKDIKSQYLDRLKKIVCSDISYGKVLDIVKEGTTEHTYDFEVKPKENFLAGVGCMIAHNTTAMRFAVSDLLHKEYKEQAKKVIKGDLEGAMRKLKETRDLPIYYSNGTHVSVDANIDIIDKINLEHVFFPIVDGGNILHIFMGESMPDPKGLKEFAFNIAKNTQVGYFAFTKDMTLCLKDFHVSPGLKDQCPNCGSSKVEHLSRITGYLQAVSGWNKGKQQELKDRKRYDI